MKNIHVILEDKTLFCVVEPEEYQYTICSMQEIVHCVSVMTANQFANNLYYLVHGKIIIITMQFLVHNQANLQLRGHLVRTVEQEGYTPTKYI